MRNDLKNSLSGLIPNEKIASADLAHLNLFELEAMLGIDKEEKVALSSMSRYGEDWLQQFSGTPLYTKAIALAEKDLKLHQAEMSERQKRKVEFRIDDSIWNKRDQISLEKDRLILELHKHHASEQKKSSIGKTASEVEYTGQVNNGDPKMPTWPRAALGVDSAGRKATPEERKNIEGDVATPQHVEPHEDGKDFVAKTSHERRLLDAVKSASEKRAVSTKWIARHLAKGVEESAIAQGHSPPHSAKTRNILEGHVAHLRSSQSKKPLREFVAGAAGGVRRMKATGQGLTAEESRALDLAGRKKVSHKIPGMPHMGKPPVVVDLKDATDSVRGAWNKGIAVGIGGGAIGAAPVAGFLGREAGFHKGHQAGREHERKHHGKKHASVRDVLRKALDMDTFAGQQKNLHRLEGTVPGAILGGGAAIAGGEIGHAINRHQKAKKKTSSDKIAKVLFRLLKLAENLPPLQPASEVASGIRANHLRKQVQRMAQEVPVSRTPTSLVKPPMLGGAVSTAPKKTLADLAHRAAPAAPVRTGAEVAGKLRSLLGRTATAVAAHA